jgi:phage major head subunit gpT-like protein
MSFLVAEKVAAAQIGFQTRFGVAFDKAPKTYERLATEVPSANAVEQHNWLADVPLMKEWIGERQLAKLRAEGFQVVNKNFASGLEVDQNDLEDDKLGQYNPKIDMLASQAMWSYELLLHDLLIAGFGTTKGTAFDGLSFFNTAHVLGDGSAQSNKATGTLDDTGVLDAGIAAFLSLKDYEGDPLNATPTHLMVGPSNRAKANELVKAQFLASGASNTNFNVVDLIISPRLVGADAGKWFLLDLSKPIKPLGLQMRKRPVFDSVTSGIDRFMKRKHYFGIEGRHAAFFGPWFFAYGSDGST